MIALLLASFFYHYIKGPVEVRWQVRWNPPLSAETHTRRFKTPTEAIEFAAHAPMCSGEMPKDPPCVEWIRVYLVKVEPWIKEAKRSTNPPPL